MADRWGEVNAPLGRVTAGVCGGLLCRLPKFMPTHSMPTIATRPISSKLKPPYMRQVLTQIGVQRVCLPTVSCTLHCPHCCVIVVFIVRPYPDQERTQKRHDGVSPLLCQHEAQPLAAGGRCLTASCGASYQLCLHNATLIRIGVMVLLILLFCMPTRCDVIYFCFGAAGRRSVVGSAI